MVSTFSWRLAGCDDDLDVEPARKLDDYELVAKEYGIEILCPECQRWIGTRFTSKQEAMASGSKSEREQFISGLCSDACWKTHLGLAEA